MVMTVDSDRAERAARLTPFFELQLRLARRVRELNGGALGDAVLRYTNFHRRFGLGRVTDRPAPAWRPYVEALRRLTDLGEQVALTQATYLGSPQEIWPSPGRTGFGCFACDDLPAEDLSVQIHFHNGDTDEAGGPLAAGKLPRRKSEMAALVAHIIATRPTVTHIRGRSWLYNLAAYRRVFPPDYGAAAAPIGSEPVNLQGHSLWGQAIDSEEHLRPAMAEAIRSALPAMDPAAPWRAFPLGVLATRSPLRSFRLFYGV